jgi:hypothetical protein
MTHNEAANQIREWSEKAISQHSTIEEQKEYVTKKIKERLQEFLDALIDWSVERYGYSILYSSRHKAKKDVMNSCVTSQKSKLTNKVHLTYRRRMNKALNVLDTFDCGGKPIGDCTREEVRQQMEYYRVQGNGFLKGANIYTDVYNKMKGASKNTLVRRCVKPEMLVSIIDKWTVAGMVV